MIHVEVEATALNVAVSGVFSYADIAAPLFFYADIAAPLFFYADIAAPLFFYADIAAPLSIPSVDGQLYDEVTGAFLYDAVTGTPLIL